MTSRKTYVKERNKFARSKKFVDGDELKGTIDRAYETYLSISNMPK